MSLPHFPKTLLRFLAPGHSLRPKKFPCRPRLECLEDRTLLNAGALDPSFDFDGKVIDGIGSFNAVAVQQDKMIVAAGTVPSPTGGYAIGLRRYLPQGSLLDMNFGSSGEVITHISNDGGFATSIALDGNDNIVVAASSAGGVAVLRYKHKDGSLDTSFGNSGVVLFNFKGDDALNSVAIDPLSGMIYVAGQTKLPTARTHDLAVARLDSSGGFDMGFGTQGKKILDLYSGSDDVAHSMALQANGGILLAGSSTDSGGGATFPVLVRLLPNGDLDTGFGFTGVSPVMYPRSGEATSVAIEKGDKIVVAGRLQSATGDEFGVTRVNTNGAIDNSFGNGLVVVDFGGPAAAHGVVVQPNGQVVVAGTTDKGNHSQFALARLDGKGSLDGNFGTGGKVTTDMGDPATAHAVTLQKDGMIVVAGGTLGGLITPSQLALARYENDQLAFIPILNPFVVSALAGYIHVTVQRTGGMTGQLTVHFATAGGTATPGRDYGLLAAILTFADGETRKDIAFPVFIQPYVRGPRTIQLALSDVRGGELGGPDTMQLQLVDGKAPSEDVTGLVRITRGRVVFNARKKTFQQRIRVLLPSGSDPLFPVFLVLDGLPRRFQVQGAGQFQGRPALKLGLASSSPFIPGEEVSLAIVLRATSRAFADGHSRIGRPRFTPRVFVGLEGQLG